MIRKSAKLRVERVPLCCLQVVETGKPWTCFSQKFQTYLDLLIHNPDEDTEPLIVTPAPSYPGLYEIRNGKHRFCANIMAGRSDTPCVIEENA